LNKSCTLHFASNRNLIIDLFANDTVVKGDSHLCIARILVPMVNRLETRSGLLYSVRDVIEELGGDAVRLRYGWDLAGKNKRVRAFEHKKGRKVRHTRYWNPLYEGRETLSGRKV
jgi:hypothetical protein